MTIPKQLVDRDFKIPEKLGGDIPSGNLKMSEAHAGQYDNPRGYFGLAGMNLAGKKETGKYYDHPTVHKMEEEGKLVRTGTPNKGR